MASTPEALTCENPFVVVGESDVVGGFKALGFRVYGIKAQNEFSAVLEEIVRTGCGVCLVQNSFYEGAKGELNSYKNLPVPVFIPFSKNGDMGLLDDIVKDIRIRATGAL